MNSRKVFLDANYIIYLNYCADDSLFDWLLSTHSRMVNAVNNGTISLFVNVLVLDEVARILHKKYHRPWQEVNEFFDRILVGMTIASLTEIDFVNMKRFMVDYNLQPSDALHASTVLKNGIDIILSEDSSFDKLPFCLRAWQHLNEKMLLTK